jgi:hypothetical protein
LAQADLRAALRSSQNIWLDSIERRGFMRTVFDPLNSEDDVPRTRFLIAARKSAEAAGLPVSTAQCMAAALRELESNIREHSEKLQTGLLAFQATHDGFEFVAADNGVGVLATLRDAPEFKNLVDHGRALHVALQEGVSRHGRDPNHGNTLLLFVQSRRTQLRQSGQQRDQIWRQSFSFSLPPEVETATIH